MCGGGGGSLFTIGAHFFFELCEANSIWAEALLRGGSNVIRSRLKSSVSSAYVKLCTDETLITLIALQLMIGWAFFSRCVTCAAKLSEKKER